MRGLYNVSVTTFCDSRRRALTQPSNGHTRLHHSTSLHGFTQLLYAPSSGSHNHRQTPGSWECSMSMNPEQHYLSLTVQSLVMMVKWRCWLLRSLDVPKHSMMFHVMRTAVECREGEYTHTPWERNRVLLWVFIYSYRYIYIFIYVYIYIKKTLLMVNTNETELHRIL